MTQPPHEIQRGYTSDGKEVVLWSDGCLTGAMGYRLPGVPTRRPKTPGAIDRCLTAGRLLLGDVALYTLEELPTLYRAAERADMPGTMRRLFSELSIPRITLHWRVVAADNRGRATERYALLPRLRWPGLVVFDFCGSTGSSRGRYHLYRRMRRIVNGAVADDAFEPTGFDFERLSDLFRHLQTEGALCTT